MFAAEAGLSEGVFALNSGNSANLGTQQQPMSIAASSFWVTETNLPNGMKALVSSRPRQPRRDAHRADRAPEPGQPVGLGRRSATRS